MVLIIRRRFLQKQLNNQFENFIIIKISPYRKIRAYFVDVYKIFLRLKTVLKN